MINHTLLCLNHSAEVSASLVRRPGTWKYRWHELGVNPIRTVPYRKGIIPTVTIAEEFLKDYLIRKPCYFSQTFEMDRAIILANNFVSTGTVIRYNIDINIQG